MCADFNIHDTGNGNPHAHILLTIANTKGEGEKSAEDFWVKSERLFYTALIGYIWYEAPAEEMNFTTLLEMINASEAREDDPDFQSPVDLMFERLEQKDPDHFAVRQYKKFLLSAGKTRSSILISCGARLAPFDIREVRELMENDEMELDTIGDEKTVLFLIMSDTDTTFNFILAIFNMLRSLSETVVLPIAAAILALVMCHELIGTFLLTPDEAEASCVSALQNGYRLIDTANAYCNEKAVGRAMKKSGLLREEIFLETKLWPTFYTDADAVDKTLARLDTDYIDLLLIHQPAGDYVAGYRLMEKAYKEGKVRAIGLSNFNEEQIKEILSICEVKPTILQTEVHPYAQQKELKAFLAENGMVIQAWYPLGHADKGLLEEPLFTRLAAKYGKSNVQIILRWHIQAGNVVIPGSKNPAHIHDNFDVFDFALTDAEMQEITTLNKDKRYYEVTEDKLAAFATMFPPVDDQK